MTIYQRVLMVIMLNVIMFSHLTENETRIGIYMIGFIFSAALFIFVKK